MITIKVGEEVYTIKDCRTVSDGKLKQFVEDCIWVAMMEFNDPADGFAEPWLYMRLSRFKSIKPISCDFKPPKQEKDTVY